MARSKTRTLLAGPHRYTVKWLSNVDYLKIPPRGDHEPNDTIGLCQNTLLTIYIRADLGDVDIPIEKQREVLWHEINHVVMDITGLNTGNTSEEMAVTALATTTLDILMRNKWLPAELGLTGVQRRDNFRTDVLKKEDSLGSSNPG